MRVRRAGAAMLVAMGLLLGWQALILITDYVYDTDGRPLHVSKRIQRTDRAKYTEPIG